MNNWRQKLNWRTDISDYIYYITATIPDSVEEQLERRFGDDEDYYLDIDDYSTSIAIRDIRKALQNLFQEEDLRDVIVGRISFIDLDSANPYHAGALYAASIKSSNEKSIRKAVDILQNAYGSFDEDLPIDKIIRKRKA